MIDAFAPSDHTIALARAWLIESGISDARISLNRNKGWLELVATAKEAEELLHTQYFQYLNAQTGHSALACEQYVEIPLQSVLNFQRLSRPGIMYRTASRTILTI